MLFTQPIPFQDAIDSRRVKSVLPSDLSSSELRAIAPELRERAIFSAHTPYAGYLDDVNSWIDQLIRPETLGPGQKLDADLIRVRMRKGLNAVGFVPTADDANTLRDLGSDSRLNLVIDTSRDTAWGYGSDQAGNDPVLLDATPAMEFFRAEERDKHRNWLERWHVAGEASGLATGWGVFDGMMIAVKNHPIWQTLGDSALFDDGLDNPYPPFAFHSGMWWRGKSRDECIKLGLIKLSTPPLRRQRRSFNADLAVSPGIRSAALRSALESSLDGIASFDDAGVLRMNL